MLSAVMLSVVTLSDIAECRYAECRYAECRGAKERALRVALKLSYIDKILFSQSVPLCSLPWAFSFISLSLRVTVRCI